MGIYVGNKRYAPYIGDKRREVRNKKALPYDAEVEYLESNGTQYIDLGFLYSTANSYEIDSGITYLAYIQQYNGWDAGGAFGTRSTGKPDDGSRNQGFGVDIKNTYVETNLIIQSGSSSNSILSVDVNGDVYNNTRTHGSLATYASNKGYRLFACYSKNKTTHYCQEAIYWCKVKINGVLAMDLIPVRVGQVGYLYDKVSKQLFANQGTGDFILGPDKT